MIKNVLKRTISIIITVLMIAAVMPSLSIPAWAADKTDSVTVTEQNYSTLEKEIEANVDSSSGCLGTTYTACTATLSVINGVNGARIISFTYVMSGASFTLNGEAITTSSGTFSSELSEGESVVFTATCADSEGAKATIKVSNFSVTTNSIRTLTFNASVGGTIKVDNEIVSSTKTVETDFATGVSVVATASSGYKFLGWIDSDDQIVSKNASDIIKPTEDMTIHALFYKESEKAYWGVDNKVFSDLDSAVAYANTGSTKTVVLLTTGILPAKNNNEGYTIPSGITVLIPFDDNNSLFTVVPGAINNGERHAYSAAKPYRTLSLVSGSRVIVSGSIRSYF